MMNNRDQLINELGAEFGVKRDNDLGNSRFQYSADTNSLYRKGKGPLATKSLSFAEKPEETTFDVPLEKDEYIEILNDKKKMLLILDKGVKVGNTIKAYEHEKLTPTGRFVLKEVVENIRDKDGGIIKSGFCVVLLK